MKPVRKDTVIQLAKPAPQPSIDGDICVNQVTGLPDECGISPWAVDPCAPGSPYLPSYVCQFRPEVYFREHPCAPGSPYLTSYICVFNPPAPPALPPVQAACPDLAIGFWFSVLISHLVC